MSEPQAGPYRRFYARDIFAVERYPLHVRRHLLSGNHIPHDHDFVEAVLVLGGQGRHRSSGGEAELKAGDTLLLRPGVWHFYHDCRNLDVYNCCFGVELLQRELAAIARNPALDNLLVSAPLSAAARGVLLLHQDETGIDTCRRCLDSILQADASACGEGSEAVATVEKIGNLLLFLAHLSRAALGVGGRETPGDTRSLHPAVREAVSLPESTLRFGKGQGARGEVIRYSAPSSAISPNRARYSLAERPKCARKRRAK